MVAIGQDWDNENKPSSRIVFVKRSLDGLYAMRFILN